MSKRKQTNVSSDIHNDDIVYVKYELKEDKNGKKKKWSVWYKGKILRILSQNDVIVNAEIEYEDDTTEIMDLKKSEYGTIWTKNEPASYKKQKKDSDGDLVMEVDYDYIINEVIKRLNTDKVLETSEDKIKKVLETSIEKYIGDLKKDSEGFLHGDITNKVIQLFDKLPAHEKAKYQGEYMMSGIVDKWNKDKGKVMCAYYKNLQYKCASLNPKIKDGVMKYVSNEARCVHLARFADYKLRSVHADKVYDSIKQNTLCSQCVSKHCTNDMFMDYGRKKEVCCMCKVKRISLQQNNADNSIPVCTYCTGTNNPSQDKEHYVKCCLEVLPKIFNEHYISVKNTVTVNVDSNGRNRYIDFVISGHHKNTKFLIIVEMDQNEHKDYDAKDERKKLAEQTAFMMRDNACDRVFIIRFNPNSDWTENGNSMNYYNTTERAVILRSWIIWYIMNLDSVRSTLILYLWYSDNRKNQLFEHTWDGFMMTNHAPRNPETSNWAYCAEPSEAIYHCYDNINNRRIDVNTIVKYWKKDDEKDQIPTSIQSLMEAGKK